MRRTLPTLYRVADVRYRLFISYGRVHRKYGQNSTVQIDKVLKTESRSLYTRKIGRMPGIFRLRIDETSLGSLRSYETVTHHQLYGMNIETLLERVSAVNRFRFLAAT
ncbi:unnamed protein product [Lasius platythorax]|uniref:Uncharacterized protein n=1 Tax=Lasius platythorax TaxID=488582 RepID=A0AAV2P1B3_9HYME